MSKDKGQFVRKSDGKGGVNKDWLKVHQPWKLPDNRTPKERADDQRIADNRSASYYEGYSAVDNE